MAKIWKLTFSSLFRHIWTFWGVKGLIRCNDIFSHIFCELLFSQGDEKPFLPSYPFSDKLSHWIKFPKINFVPVFFLCKSYTYFNLWIFVLFRSGQLFSQGERNLRISGHRESKYREAMLKNIKSQWVIYLAFSNRKKQTYWNSKHTFLAD